MENIESITEEKEAKLPFYSYRSVLKCYSAGISFVTDNFLFILKTFSPVFACSALFFAIWLDLLYSFQPYFILMSFIAFFLFAVNYYVVMAMTFRVFDQIALDKGFLGYNAWTLFKATRKKFVKMFHWFLICFVVVLVALIPTFITAIVLYSGMDKTTPLETIGTNVLILYGVMLINLIIFGFVVGVPMYMSMFYVMMEKGSSIKNAWKGLKVGYRLWAKCFGLLLLMVVTFDLLGAVFCSLLSVMYSAKAVAITSAAQGDIVYLPEAINWILPIVSFVTVFFSCFIDVMAVSCGIYLYASAKTDEKNKENAIVFVDGESK